MDYMTRKIETCIYIQRQSRYHRVSTNVTRLARLSAKSNVYLVAMRHAVSGWHLKTQPTHIHISYYSSPAKHKSTTTSSQNSTAEFQYSITRIESFQTRSSSHTNKAPPAKSDLSRAQHPATFAISIPHRDTHPQHLHNHTMSTMSAPSTQGSKAAAPASGNVIKR